MSEIVNTELRTEVLTWPDRARGLRIVDDATFEAAAGVLKAIKGLRQKIADTFDEPIKKAHAAHKAMLAAKAEHEKPLEEAESIIKRTMTSYRTEQERRAAEERARLEAEARRLEEERRLAEAEALEAAGEADMAMAVLSEPVVMPVVQAPAATPKVEGLSFATTYGAEVVDMAAFARFAASTPSMLNLLMPNGPALNALARAQREAFNIPGCRLVKTTAPRSRTA